MLANNTYFNKFDFNECLVYFTLFGLLNKIPDNWIMSAIECCSFE